MLAARSAAKSKRSSRATTHILLAGARRPKSTVISQRPGAIEACEIFCCPVGGPDGAGDGRGPERYVVPPEDTGVGSYLYVLAWADESTTQGTLGQLRRTDGKGNTFYTGQGDWQVCATGKNLERNSNPPTKEWIKTETC